MPREAGDGRGRRGRGLEGPARHRWLRTHRDGSPHSRPPPPVFTTLTEPAGPRGLGKTNLTLPPDLHRCERGRERSSAPAGNPGRTSQEARAPGWLRVRAWLSFGFVCVSKACKTQEGVLIRVQPVPPPPSPSSCLWAPGSRTRTALRLSDSAIRRWPVPWGARSAFPALGLGSQSRPANAFTLHQRRGGQRPTTFAHGPGFVLNLTLGQD